jgi:hypothetical protein
MTVPLFGLIFIPLALWIFLARRQYLVPLLVLSSIFQAASVLNLNLRGFPVGVQPYYFVALLVSFRAYRERAVTWSRLRLLAPQTKGVLRALLAFCGWAVASAFFLPFMFAGIGIVDPRSALGESGYAGDVGLRYAILGDLTPLKWSFTNLGQAVYLVLNAVAVAYAAAVGIQGATSRRVLRSLRIAVFVACFVSFAQVVAELSAWNFPYAFLNSNPVYSQGYNQAINGFHRANSTFTEPSYAGGFLAAALLGLVGTGTYSRLKSVLGVSVVALAVVLTTSSTGLATVAAGMGILAFYRLRRGQRPHVQRAPAPAASGGFGFPALVLLLVTGFFLIMWSKLREAVLEMTLYKFGTLSALSRFSVGIYSLKLVVRTCGLGLGLGSNRSFDALTYIVSNLGIVGMVLFGLFATRLVLELRDASRAQPGGHTTMLMWMLLGALIAQIIGVPDLNWAVTWAVVVSSLCVLASRDAVWVTKKLRCLKSGCSGTSGRA